MKQKLGVISGANIAYSRFLPALMECNVLDYVGVASNNLEKQKVFKEKFSGEIYKDYISLIEDRDVDCIYLPLPPSLHYKWGKEVLKNKKHLFMEKPFTCSVIETKDLVEIARENGLVLFENYAFPFHNQFSEILKIISENQLGDLRLIRSVFCFPKRGEGDFRYDKAMGGGALLDCGGYPIRVASEILGESAKVIFAEYHVDEALDVDLYGSVVMQNKDGVTAQLAFGMDNAYKCELEIIGQYGWIRTGRIFTATSDLEPIIEYNIQNQSGTIVVEKDNQFGNVIRYFNTLIEDESLRENEYKQIVRQAELVQQVMEHIKASKGDN